MPYITPASTPSQTVRRCLFIPDDPLWLAAVSGALTELLYTYNWEDIDGLTAEEAVATARVMIDSYYEGACGVSRVGEVIMTAAAAIPSNCLPCDGGTYSGNDYPELMAVIDSNLIVLPSSFRTPALNGRSPVGTGQYQMGGNNYQVGDVAGTEAVTLSINHVPAHTHLTWQGNQYTTVEPSVSSSAVALQAGGALSGYETGSRGANAAHENRHPVSCIRYGIIFED